MRAGPSVYQLEKAIKLYEDESAPVDVAKWRRTDWVYHQLGSLGKALSYVGVPRFSWWKRTFILPILCRESGHFLSIFQDGDWVKADEPSFSTIFDFFSSAAKQVPHLFEKSALTFLSQKKPSFSDLRDEAFLASVVPGKTKELTWKCGETYKDYRKRVSEAVVRSDVTKKTEIRPRIDMEAPLEPVREESVVRWKTIMQQVPQLTKDVIGLSKEIEGNFVQARAIRSENGALYDRLFEMKKTVVEMLDALEVDYPSLELLSQQVSQPYFSRLIYQEEQVLSKIRKNYSAMQKALLEDRGLILGKKDEFSQLCRQLSKLLDCVPLLPQESVFKAHQARVLKEARDMLKDLRNAFSRGIDIGMTFENFQQKISIFEDFARKFYNEGTRIDLLREKLILLEKRIEALPSQGSSKRSSRKQNLREQVVEYRKTFEFSCQREVEFERIENALCALEE